MIGRERWRFGTHPSRQAAKACPVGGARTWPGLAGLLAAILAGTIDFVPAAGLAVGSALLATLPAWWIYGQPSRRTSLRGSRKTIDRACMVFLFAGTWATLAILVPCLPTVLGGPLTVERHDVLSRQAPWRGGLCHALRIEDFGWPAPRPFASARWFGRPANLARRWRYASRARRGESSSMNWSRFAVAWSRLYR